MNDVKYQCTQWKGKNEFRKSRTKHFRYSPPSNEPGNGYKRVRRKEKCRRELASLSCEIEKEIEEIHIIVTTSFKGDRSWDKPMLLDGDDAWSWMRNSFKFQKFIRQEFHLHSTIDTLCSWAACASYRCVENLSLSRDEAEKSFSLVVISSMYVFNANKLIRHSGSVWLLALAYILSEIKSKASTNLNEIFAFSLLCHEWMRL